MRMLNHSEYGIFYLELEENLQGLTSIDYVYSTIIS